MLPDDPSFDIALRYVGAEPSAAQKAIVRQAADVWERVITYGIPDRFIDSSSVICDDGDPSLFGAHVDDLVVHIKVRAIDGQGGTLAQAGPCWTRLPSRLPYLGIVILDSADLTALHNAGVLRRIVTHEIGHALGFGTSWDQMAGPDGLPLLRQPSLAPDDAVLPGRDTSFSGRAAVDAFDAAGGRALPGRREGAGRERYRALRRRNARRALARIGVRRGIDDQLAAHGAGHERAAEPGDGRSARRHGVQGRRRRRRTVYPAGVGACERRAARRMPRRTSTISAEMSARHRS